MVLKATSADDRTVTHCNNPATISLGGPCAPASRLAPFVATHDDMSPTRVVKLAGNAAGTQVMKAATEK